MKLECIVLLQSMTFLARAITVFAVQEKRLMWAAVWMLMVGLFGATALAAPDDESIYALPEPPKESDGVNEGGVHLDLTVRYMTDYVYRGVDSSEVGGHEDAANLQFDGQIEFDLGKAPHPFLGTFVNVYNADPISRFQEIRPFFGLEWTARPLIMTAGHTTYILPERETMNTSEVYGKLQIDDSFFFRTDRAIFSPYVYAAYDYDLNSGWYMEGGLQHTIPIEDLGMTFMFYADVAYIIAHQHFVLPGGRDTGFHHYDLGVTGSYSLNSLLSIPKRYGDFALQGYLNYTDGINEGLNSTTQLWGGFGIAFHY